MTEGLATIPIAYDPNHGLQRPWREGWRISPLLPIAESSSSPQQQQKSKSSIETTSPPPRYNHTPQWFLARDITDSAFYDPDAVQYTEKKPRKPSNQERDYVVDDDNDDDDDVDFLMAMLGGCDDAAAHKRRRQDSSCDTKQDNDREQQQQQQQQHQQQQDKEKPLWPPTVEDEDVQDDVDFWHSLMPSKTD